MRGDHLTQPRNAVIRRALPLDSPLVRFVLAGVMGGRRRTERHGGHGLGNRLRGSMAALPRSIGAAAAVLGPGAQKLLSDAWRWLPVPPRVASWVTQAMEPLRLPLFDAERAVLLDAALDAVISADATGRITEFNAAAERMFGYTRAEVLGRPLAAVVVPPALRERHEKGFEQYRRTGKSRIIGKRIEINAMRTGGAEFPVELTVTRAASDGPAAFTAHVRDISDRRRVEDERRRLLAAEQAARAEAEAAAELVRRVQTITDAALASLSLEELLRELLPRIQRALATDTVVILLAEADGTLVVRAALGLEDDAQRAVRIPIGEGFAGRIAAERRPVVLDDVDYERVVSRYMRDKAIRSLAGVPLMVETRLVGVLHVGSVHSRMFRRDEVELLQLAGDRVALAIERAVVHDAERRARAEAEAAARTMDDFLATVSHELRTPLTPILSWTHMLRGGKLGADQAARALAVIERNVKLQARLIDDLLDVSRIMSGKVHMEMRPVELPAVVEAEVEVVRPAAETKGVALAVRVDADIAPIGGDADRLRQVVSNLLSNAVKFTPQGGRVDVTVRRLPTGVELTVRDTGKGISSEFLPHIFERFRQADSSATRAYGGLGLGLAIARHLIELHGGTVRAGSDGEGRGATFTAVFPLPAVTLPAPPMRVDRPRQPTRSIDGARVLLVEDDTDTRSSILAVLEAAGARVTAVSSAADALDAIGQSPPDVLVSDIGMPGDDGYALIRRVREVEAAEGARIPALALTGYAGAHDRARALATGFQRWLAKPIEAQELLGAIAQLLSSGAEAPRTPASR